MEFRKRSRWSRAAVLGGSVLWLGVLALGCSQSPGPRAPNEGHPASSQESADRSDGESEAASSEGRDATVADEAATEEREWHVDERGRRYYLLEIPKHAGHYRRLDDGRVRLSNGLTLTVEEEREETFVVRAFDSGRDRARSEADTEDESADEPPELGSPIEQVDRLTFEPVGEGLPERGQWRNGFEIADMNGDGVLDIVHGPARKSAGRPAIFLGREDGTWRRWREARFEGPRLDYGDVAVADFDGDGVQDVAFGVHLRGVQVFVGDGRGRFRPWSDGIQYAVPRGGRAQVEFSTRSIVANDWNGDGRPDLLALGEGPQPVPATRPAEGQEREFQRANLGPVLILNRGDGKWDFQPLDRPGEQRHFGDDLAVGDLDGDGADDFVVASMSGGQLDLVYLRGAEGEWRARGLEPVPEGSLVHAVEIADFDRDGIQDLAVAYLEEREEGGWRPRVDLLLNRREEGWDRRALYRKARAPRVWSLAAGDLDGDGDPDLAGFDGRGQGLIFLNALEEDGRFLAEESEEVASSGAGCRGYHAAIRDLDGDGKGELIAGFAGESGSETMFGQPARCTNGGEIRVWKQR